jgi:glycosyltransferase involved in cell wall biosynthesis
VKVALIHEYLIKQGGSENVLEALIEIFPEAPIFTSFFSPKTMPERWSQRTIYSSFLQKFPLGRQNYQKRLQYFLPLMPTAYESFDLREYDLVISSSHAFAKGVLTRPDALHISYIHTPTRYLWDLTWEYQRSFKQLPLLKSLVPLAISQLRTWDFQAAQRPDALIANSKYIQRRIQKFYRRDAELIYPPVDTDFFRPQGNNTPANFYLIAGRFVPYKRLDLAIQAFNQLGLPLWVVGEGPEVERLKPSAKANILFKPHQPRRALADIFAQCRALIFPGEEDFGILPVEVQASGRPVIAFGRGGATETVCNGLTGILFKEQTTKSLVEAVQYFEASVFDPEKIMAHAEQFSRQRFQAQIRKFLEESQMSTT